MIQFGILGAGNIAHKFANAVAQTKGANLCAIASKSIERAQKFAAEENIPNAYGNYEDFFQNPAIDVVYIATTNNFHYQNILDALNAGKHVICEKPMTLTYKEAKEVTTLATKKGLFLMEAMWTRFLPKSQRVLEWVRSGAIGQIKLMQATIGWVSDPKINARLYDFGLGGGSLYDLGVYPLDLLPYYTGQNIISIQKLVHSHSTGVDDTVSLNIELDHSFANIQCSFITKVSEDAFLYGDKGYIRIPKLHFGNKAELYDLNDTLIDSFDEGVENGFLYQVEEVVRCIENGQTESSVCPLKMTLETAKWYDEILS